MTDFKTQLLALRKARGLTQRRVAEICGVSTVTVWNWEKGRATPWSAAKVLATIGENRPTGKDPALAAPYSGEPQPPGDPYKQLARADPPAFTLPPRRGASTRRRIVDNIGE